MIKVERLNAGYGKFQVLFNVDTIMEEGKMTAIVGPNGSGKSTVLKSIFGLTKIYSGEIYYGEERITRTPPHQVARKGIAYVPQVGNVFQNLTIRENLMMSGYTLEKKEVKRRIEEVLGFYPILKEFYGRKANTLSGGERQMLAMAMGLTRSPKVMLFDEPTASLSPKIATEVLREIKKLRDDLKITIILVEQNVINALKIADHALLLVGGKVNFDGAPQELLDSPELGSLYLGLKFTTPA